MEPDIDKMKANVLKNTVYKGKQYIIGAALILMTDIQEIKRNHTPMIRADALIQGSPGKQSLTAF